MSIVRINLVKTQCFERATPTNRLNKNVRHWNLERIRVDFVLIPGHQDGLLSDRVKRWISRHVEEVKVVRPPRCLRRSGKHLREIRRKVGDRFL
jgi:hypothetical protein